MSTTTAEKVIEGQRRISTLDDVADVLNELAYVATRSNGGDSDTVVTLVSVDGEDGAESRSFPVVLTIEDEVLEITAQFATASDFSEDVLPEILWKLLDANTEINPIAAAINTGDGSDVANAPFVLTDKLPLGDLSDAELQFAMESLREAAVAVVEVLDNN